MQRFYVAAFFLTVVVCQDLKAPCAYNHEKRTYFCSKIKDKFPSMFYGNYHLKCTDCEIPIFGPGTFPVQAELHSFNLSNSGIQQISGEAFSVLPLLQYLYLQNNKITNIRPNAFNNLKRLYELDLENNKISKLHRGIFGGLEAVSVSLYNNQIKEIPSKVFEGVLGIMAFNLSSNQIGILFAESLFGLHNTEILDLQNNRLCYIPLGIFKNVPLLRVLNLSDNKLRSFLPGTLSGLKSLITLHLAKNEFAEFDPSVLLSVSRISHLDLSRNDLYYLDGHAIHTNAPTIRTLTISDNLWTCAVLTNLIQYFKTVNIDTSETTVDRYRVTNINGIACSMEPIDISLSFEKFLETVAYFTNKSINYC